jgi:hypothetical protein
MRDDMGQDRGLWPLFEFPAHFSRGILIGRVPADLGSAATVQKPRKDSQNEWHTAFLFARLQRRWRGRALILLERIIDRGKAARSRRNVAMP